MAGHAQLKCVMTECSKTQIRLTGLICGMKGSGKEDNQLRSIRRMVGPALRKMTMKDKVKDIIYTDRKIINQTWCFEATEFKFYGNDVGTLRQHTALSRRFNSVANNAGKLIVIANCKIF